MSLSCAVRYVAARSGGYAIAQGWRTHRNRFSTRCSLMSMRSPSSTASFALARVALWEPVAGSSDLGFDAHVQVRCVDRNLVSGCVTKGSVSLMVRAGWKDAVMPEHDRSSLCRCLGHRRVGYEQKLVRLRSVPVAPSHRFR